LIVMLPKVRLRNSVVWQLSRSLIEAPTEPWILMYGKNSEDHYLVTSVHNCSEAERREGSVKISAKSRKKLRGYDRALASNSRANNQNGLYETDFIGHAHAHNRLFFPSLSKEDIEVAEREMKKRNMYEWLEIVLWYKNIDPRGLKKYLPEKNSGIIYRRDEQRPRLKIFDEETNLGIDITYFGFIIHRDDMIQREVPVYFGRRAFRKISLML